VTSAPSRLVPTRMNRRTLVPISLSRIGKRNAVRTAPVLAKEAARPAPAPRMEVGKTSPAIKVSHGIGRLRRTLLGPAFHPPLRRNSTRPNTRSLAAFLRSRKRLIQGGRLARSAYTQRPSALGFHGPASGLNPGAGNVRVRSARQIPLTSAGFMPTSGLHHSFNDSGQMPERKTCPSFHDVT